MNSDDPGTGMLVLPPNRRAVPLALWKVQPTPHHGLRKAGFTSLLRRVIPVAARTDQLTCYLDTHPGLVVGTLQHLPHLEYVKGLILRYLHGSGQQQDIREECQPG